MKQDGVTIPKIFISLASAVSIVMLGSITYFVKGTFDSSRKQTDYTIATSSTLINMSTQIDGLKENQLRQASIQEKQSKQLGELRYEFVKACERDRFYHAWPEPCK